MSDLFGNLTYGALSPPQLPQFKTQELNCRFDSVVNEVVEVLTVLFVFPAVDDARGVDRAIDGQNTVEVIELWDSEVG